MEALGDFREWLVEIREDNANRLPVQRNGNAKRRADGSTIFGPFRLEVQKAF